MDVHSLRALQFYLLKCGILTPIILGTDSKSHLEVKYYVHLCTHLPTGCNHLNGKLCNLILGLYNYG